MKNVNDRIADTDLSSDNIQFTLDIRDDENNINFLNNSTSVDENTSLNDSTATYVGGYKLAYSNSTENDIALTFELSGTANSSTDYNVRTAELSSEFVWIVPKNTIKSFPVDTLNVDVEKTLILTIKKIDILNDDGTIKNGDIIPVLPNAQKQTLTILDTDNSGGSGSSGENSAPTVVGEGIPDMKVVMGYGDMISSTTLTTYFTDTDGDTLTFTATSSDPNNINAFIDADGNLVMLSPNVNLTNVDVTVTADDGNGGTFEDTFVVSVIGNEVSFDISYGDVSEDDGTYTINLHSLKKAEDSGAAGPEGSFGNSNIRAYIKVDETSTVTNEDYSISAPTSTSEVGTFYMVEIPVGATSTSFDVVINDDDVKEAKENLSMTLVMGEGTSYVNADADNFVLFISDNDNSYPEVSQIDEQSVVVGQSLDFDFDDYVSDPDGDILTFKNTGLEDSDIISLDFNSETHIVTILGVSEGYSNFGFNITDPYGAGFDLFVRVSVSANEENSGNENPGSTGGSSSNGGGSSLLPNTAPQAGVTTGQEVTVEVNKEITFDASQSMDKENNIRFYFWNFGDGSSEVYYTVPTTIHTYTKVGVYTLTIKVKDAFGEESSAQVKVNVVAGSSTTTPNTDTTGNTTDNTETNNNTETETDKNTTDNTDTTPVNNTDSNTPVNNNEEETTTEEESTTEEENTSTEEEPTSENTEEEITEEVPAETTEELPTWIKIIFGSGALAAVAGAGLAINKVRKSV